MNARQRVGQRRRRMWEKFGQYQGAAGAFGGATIQKPPPPGRRWRRLGRDELDVVRDGLVWYWDHEGRPCSLMTWGREFEHRYLRRTWVGDELVITAYLGMNDGVPLPLGQVPQALYGTLVGGREIMSPSRAEAELVHDAQVEALITERRRRREVL